MSGGSRRRFGLSALFVAVAMMAALLIPMAGGALANHGSFTVLEVVEDSTDRGVGAQVTFTAQLCDGPQPQTAPDEPCETPHEPSNDDGPVSIDGENLNGPNDPDDGNTPLSPDYTCDVLPGTSTCTISFTGTATGTDQIRFWIDHDGLDTSVEADTTEGRNEQQNPGATQSQSCLGGPGATEKDCTDVVEVTWGPGAPAQLDCDDSNGPNREQETNPSGGAAGNETYTCYVRDAFGNLTGDAQPAEEGIQQFQVRGENETPPGVNDPDNPDSSSYNTYDYTCDVGRPDQFPFPEDEGQCEITVTQVEGELGTAEICFWVGDTNGATLCASETTFEHAADTGDNTTGNDLADQVELTWVPRSSANGGVDAEPEADSQTVGQNASITATVYDQFGTPFNGNTTVNFEFFAGSPHDTDGNSPASPDMTCTTTNSSTCTETYSEDDPGRDLVCVWINGTPTMSGTNENGTCDGEGLTDADDTAGSADSPSPLNDDQDVVQRTWTPENPANRIDCFPETDRTPRGGTYTLTCSAFVDDDPAPDTEIDIEAVGSNDPDGTDSKQSPDFTCTTGPSGSCSVTHSVGLNGELGDTRYRAWSDSNYFNGSSEADNSEQRDEEAAGGAGATAEPDTTDVVTNRWVINPNRSISIRSNRKSQERGKFVRFRGRIDGDPACESGQTVRLRARRIGRTFRTVSATTTDEGGNYRFRIKVRKTKEYKAIAVKNANCNKAGSRIIKVRARR